MKFRYILNITQPSTVKISGARFCFVRVFDSGNELEYERNFYSPTSECMINLPVVGKYTLIVDNLIKIDYLGLIKNKLLVLPRFDRIPNDINVKIQKTNLEGSPARINIKTKIVLVNKKYQKLPKYIRRFILAHEIGHLYYNSEENSDLWATNYLFSLGYNQSQCTNSLINSLVDSNQKKERVNFNFKNICNHGN